MRTVSVAIIAALFSAGGYAQMGPPHGGFGHDGFREGGPAFAMRGGRVVTGAPFSATITSQATQTLVGGNTIQRTVTGSVARDTQGRTVNEETITGGPLGGATPHTMKFLFDPVAGYSYSLNLTQKVATRRAIRTGAGKHAEESAPEEATNKNPNVSVSTTNGSYLGFPVQIKTITRTIPAGAMGNAAPIVSTSQVYYSTELKTVLYSTRNDPRSGVSTYKLTDIQTAEPAAAEFQLPSDFTVEDAPWRGGHPPAPPTQ